MIFINPMWYNESERIGKQMCAPLGYKLHGISDGLGFLGLLLFVGTLAYLAYAGFTGSFHIRLLWLLTIPLGIGIIGSMLYRYSWTLADRKQWSYDYENREASWMEDGQRRTFKWKAEP
jgi:hypothetical protein